ncbi:MAG: PilZ domain-containing protein [Bradymonadia bacterium]
MSKTPHPNIEFTVRRTAPRAPIELDVSYHAGARDADRTGNLSGTGVFIRCAEPLPMGTEQHFLLHLPNLERPLSVPGVVRWAIEPGQASDQDSGMGVEFIFRSEEERQALRRVVDDLIQDTLAAELYALLGGGRD